MLQNQQIQTRREIKPVIRQITNWVKDRKLVNLKVGVQRREGDSSFSFCKLIQRIS